MTSDASGMRQRTIEWSNPRSCADSSEPRSGLAYLQAMADRLLSNIPISVLVDMQIAEVTRGHMPLHRRCYVVVILITAFAAAWAIPTTAMAL